MSAQPQHWSNSGSHRSPRWLLLPLTFVLVAGLISACGETSEPTMLDSEAGVATSDPVVEANTPRLVLLLVVDQMRGDYLDRFAPLFSSGFKRLRLNGQLFTDAHQDHASTSTSPGHATIATGMHPSSHGIINNNWFDRELGKAIYSVEDPEFGRSPTRLLTPTLGERLKSHWSKAKVVTLGGKDRSAVLTAGSDADGVYWYNARAGRFTTSSFYNKTLGEDSAEGSTGLPAWLDTFHDAGWPDQFFGTAWTPKYSLAELQTAGIRGVAPLDRGPFTRSFPHSFGGAAMTPGESFYRSIYASPLIDDYVGELAAAAIVGEALGQDEVPDLLAVNFSATDAIGHSYGPDSPELIDTLVRLDDTIGRLLDAVDRLVGLDNVVIAMSSDHGVGQVPEVALERGRDAGRLGTETALCFQQIGQDLTRRFNLEGVDWMPSLFYFDRAELAANGVELDVIRGELAAAATRCPRVARVLVPADLENGAADPLIELFEHNYREGTSPDLFVHLAPNTLATSTTASHGSAHRYDTWVPMLFKVPNFPAQRIAGRASVTDIVPTLAAVLGLPGADYDGLNRLTQFEAGQASWQE